MKDNKEQFTIRFRLKTNFPKFGQKDLEKNCHNIYWI